MPSLSYETEEGEFRRFYDENARLLLDAKNSFVTLVNALIKGSADLLVSKIDGRVKEKDECVKKFKRKYLLPLEETGTAYSIKDHITDLIGLRIVCLYEDEIEKVRTCLESHFQVIDVTDKITQIQNTEDSFGYKGLHLDLQLNEDRKNLPEYSNYGEFRFEVQIRTIIQDAWSVLDHKIKYKKVIPNSLKRRINTLAALFELADREFKEIRDATHQEYQKEVENELEDVAHEDIMGKESELDQAPANRYARLNAFSFLRIAQHFFPGIIFEPHKVDGFTQDIVRCSPLISRGKFNYYMRENITKVKAYASGSKDEQNPDELFSPYSMIRHCLYLGDKQKFSTMLSNDAKASLDKWITGSSQHQDPAGGGSASVVTA
jgi:ppGpp synthetase/RelA/SpoT-type nucleotidyltranferase